MEDGGTYFGVVTGNSNLRLVFNSVRVVSGVFFLHFFLSRAHKLVMRRSGSWVNSTSRGIGVRLTSFDSWP